MKNLRQLLREALECEIVGYKHSTLHELTDKLELRQPLNENVSRVNRVMPLFEEIKEEELNSFAEKLLGTHNIPSYWRIPIEDELWKHEQGPSIPKKIRRQIAGAIDEVTVQLHGEEFMKVMDRVFMLEDPPAYGERARNALRSAVDQHVAKYQDWNLDVLCETVGAYEVTDKRFVLFLEGLVSPEVRPDEESQRDFVRCVNVYLSDCGAEFYESGQRDGYPVFHLASKHDAAKGKPINLVFAS